MENVLALFYGARIAAAGILTVLLCACGAFDVRAQALDVPYVSTPDFVVEEMLNVAGVGPGDYVIDLGSGDGRIVIAAARRGAMGHGVDLDPRRVEEAIENAEAAGVSDRVMFLEEDIFETDFNEATVITMYLLSSVNIRLRPELLERLEPGTRVVSHAFDMGDWEPDEHLLVDNRNVFFWIIPARVEGTWRWVTNGGEFSMSVEREYQNIDITLNAGNNSYAAEHASLRGDRIGFSVRDEDTGVRYVYSGRIDGDDITGTVQVRTGNSRHIENWSAVRGR
jgi:hypothetical protein